MGSYLYELNGKSPLADIVKTPAFMKPITDIAYYPIKMLAESMSRPED